MSFNYTLKYRTFDQLLSEVMIDFQSYNLENFIESQQLIKVAKRVNYDLGLRIFQTKEALIEIDKKTGRLPDNFYVLNFALLCDEYTVNVPQSQGTWIEERPYIAQYQETPPIIDVCVPPTINCTKCNNIDCNCQEPSVAPYDNKVPYGSYCIKPRVFLNCKGDAYELVQIVRSETRTYKRLWPITIINNPENIDCDCPNLYWRTQDQAWIKDGYIYTTFDCGKIYINYQGMLEDDDGNLLVPDHDLLNDYYEYAVKKRILENLLMNDEAVVQKLQYIELEYRKARIASKSMVNTPNFSEMKQLWEANRKAQYAKYYNMFKSYSKYSIAGNSNSYTNSRTLY